MAEEKSKTEAFCQEQRQAAVRERRLAAKQAKESRLQASGGGSGTGSIRKVVTLTFWSWGFGGSVIFAEWFAWWVRLTVRLLYVKPWLPGAGTGFELGLCG